MNWRFVLQPDGLLARFSEDCQDFTDYALSEEEALAECARIRMEPGAARRLVQEALEDRCHVSGLPGGKLHRWNEAVGVIRFEHGERHCSFALEEMGFPVPGAAPSQAAAFGR